MSGLDILFRHDPSPVSAIASPVVEERGVELFLKRDEQLQAGPGLALCGNKWRKLQYNLQAARDQGLSHLLTFGGAYSNHIAALAAAGAEFSFKTMGVIRGERPAKLNPTLRLAEECGMQLIYISRSAYKERHDPAYHQQLQHQFGPVYIIPEGGTNAHALEGCKAIATETEQQLGCIPDYYALSVGTAGTLAGLTMGASPTTSVLGFSSLKNGQFLEREVEKWLAIHEQKTAKWSIQTSYHFGGYAKFKPGLITFIQDFYRSHGIPLDPIYTGKMMYGLMDMIRHGHFAQGSRIVAVHTGGLQGIRGFNERFGGVLDLGI